MDERRLDRPASLEQAVKQPRYNPACHLLDRPLIRGPRPVALHVPLAHAQEQLPVEHSPALLPVDHVRPVAVAGRHVEAELAVGRLALPVQLRQPAAELGRIRTAGHVHVDVLGDVEVRGRARRPELAESDGRRDEVGHDAVDDLGRFTFAA